MHKRNGTGMLEVTIRTSWQLNGTTNVRVPTLSCAASIASEGTYAVLGPMDVVA